ncbi:MAG TPA: type II secretion system protein [Thermoanaerobaculia bacterium]|nr:type II secretion system protein [Thermoanaerobaculia bacterium]
MKRRRERGFSLLEVAVSLAVFGIFLAIVFTLTAEMRNWEKRLPINFMKNPQVVSVLARLRRDVLDVHVPPNEQIYLDEHDGYKNGEKILILETLLPTGLQKIVWDFTEPTVVKRIAYNVGVPSVWVARGLPPEFTSGVEIKAAKFPGRVYGVRLIAKDSNGKIAIDQILQPRAHK